MPSDSDKVFQYDFSPDILAILLRDRTTGRNILWATHDYESMGAGYHYSDEIRPELITGTSAGIIMPRVLKSKERQFDRSKDMAEVFTPSWVCNAQNNLIDDAWSASGEKSWQDYVCATCLEITCGEAPYLVSPYDTTSGAFIPLEKRIGLLDRKLRAVCDNTQTPDQWLQWAQIAYQNTYGYEWQGDSLLLARENLLLTFIQFFRHKFGSPPSDADISTIAHVISWNLWQMDGLKGVVPDSCRDGVTQVVTTLFGEEEQPVFCPGCRHDDIRCHNGTYCLIRDWSTNKTIRFIDLIR